MLLLAEWQVAGILYIEIVFGFMGMISVIVSSRNYDGLEDHE